MEEKEEHINDTKMIKGYGLFMKFLDHYNELTAANKRDLEEMGIIV